MNVAILAALLACGDAGTDTDTHPGTDADTDPHTDTPTDVACSSSQIDPARFLAEGLVSPISEQDCQLSNGTIGTCYRIEVRSMPPDHGVGPFCPLTIEDDAGAGGLWLVEDEVYDVDGPFVARLAEIYDDPEWRMYDPATGEIHRTIGPEACAAVARIDPDPAYTNLCIDCLASDIEGGVSHILLIPKAPIDARVPRELGPAVLQGQDLAGLALNGVRFDPPAPIPVIIGNHNIAPFDDCGAHISPMDGYHYHLAGSCSTRIDQCDGHAPLLGYAIDGYGIHAMTGDDGAEPADLDVCRGHADGVRGYHYHAAAPEENAIVGCFRGETFVSALKCGHPTPEGLPCCGDGACNAAESLANCPRDC